MKRERFDRHGRVPRLLAAFTVLVGAAVLSGCASSPPARFYTLGGESPSGQAAAAGAAKSPPFLIEVPTLDVPSQVARNQLVVRDRATRVTVLEQERWASPPADELRRALSGDLASKLGTFDVYGSPHPENVPVYRIAVNVRRFESWPGSRAVLDAVWSVRALRAQTVVTCRTVETEAVGPGFDALVDGHRRAVGALSDTIASVVQAMASAARPSALHVDAGDCTTGSTDSARGTGAP